MPDTIDQMLDAIIKARNDSTEAVAPCPCQETQQ